MAGATAICKNCGEQIHTTHWGPSSPWSHGARWDDNQPNCPSRTQAEPRD